MDIQGAGSNGVRTGNFTYRGRYREVTGLAVSGKGTPHLGDGLVGFIDQVICRGAERNLKITHKTKIRLIVLDKSNPATSYTVFFVSNAPDCSTYIK